MMDGCVLFLLQHHQGDDNHCCYDNTAHHESNDCTFVWTHVFRKEHLENKSREEIVTSGVIWMRYVKSFSNAGHSSIWCILEKKKQKNRTLCFPRTTFVDYRTMWLLLFWEVYFPRMPLEGQNRSQERPETLWRVENVVRGNLVALGSVKSCKGMNREYKRRLAFPQSQQV